VLAATCPGKYSSGALSCTQSSYNKQRETWHNILTTGSNQSHQSQPLTTLLHTDSARVSPSAETPYVGLGDSGTTAARISVETTPLLNGTQHTATERFGLPDQNNNHAAQGKKRFKRLIEVREGSQRQPGAKRGLQ